MSLYLSAPLLLALAVRALVLGASEPSPSPAPPPPAAVAAPDDTPCARPVGPVADARAPHAPARRSSLIPMPRR